MDANILNNEEVIKKVKKFIAGLTYKLDKSNEEVIDFIEETKSNILSSIQDLVSKGHTADDAFKIVVKEFGDIETLQYELNTMYKVRKTIRKSLLALSIVFLIIGCSLFAYGYSYQKHIESIYNNTLLNPVLNEIGTIEKPISDAMKNKVKSIVANNSFVEAGGIFASKLTRLSEDKSVYEETQPYKNDKNFRFAYLYPSSLQTDNNKYFSDKEGLIFNHKADEIYYFPFPYTNTDTDIAISIVYRIKNISKFYYYLCFGMCLVYWMVFALWAGLNILNERKNNLWIVLILLTNVIGYGLYKSYHVLYRFFKFGLKISTN